ncbi:hypothetical protein CU097_004317 [Rhizopus azygosporus]|uniref:Phosphatidate cytidylyltransferase n=1 Tax=Rhizopus azygosporus TaxID=86630 RepID=A0A367IX72_RHIAZ|nr:hypothetical protein CU097_004317 [Rhizopus azygosporus]CEG71702.1 Putative Phosphatidate cytidylyltransferase [Rhizopus microsporus]CEI89839.1 Putative Phosphatidate cytidylyltransferase [Rhizopus microsporus]
MSQVKPDNSRYSLVPVKGSWEIPRKLFHFSIGFLVLYLYMNGVDTDQVYPKLAAFLAIVVTAELLRFNFEWFNIIYCQVCGPLMRTTEIKQVNGVVYYLLGCIIVLYFFPRDLAALSIIYLSWADPIASICGKLWGKYTIQYSGKSLAGSLGAVALGSLVTYVYFGPLSYYPQSYNTESSPVPLTIFSVYGGLVAGISEALGNSVFGFDDNLTIPVISAVMLWIPLVGLGLGY